MTDDRPNPAFAVNVCDFALEPNQLERLDGLEENLTTGWDPAGED